MKNTRAETQILKKRVRAIRQSLKKAKANRLIVTHPANITYVTGFSGEDSWAMIGPAAVYLITDSRYTEQAASQCPDCRIIQRKTPITNALAKLLKNQKSPIALEKSTSLAIFEALKKQIKATIKPIADIIESVRIIKDPGEISAIKTAGKIAATALKQTSSDIKPGVSESELAGLLDYQIRKLGAKNSFDTIVAFGPNASLPHHQPGSRKLKKNDTVLIDFGAKYKNYCSDLTRCFAIGKATKLYTKAYKIVQHAQWAALMKVKAKVDIEEIDSAARKVIESSGLPVYGHGTGHGLGLEVHEKPVIGLKIKGKLQAGMVFTIEPGVYMPGKLGIRIEDDVLVTENGYQILSG